MHSVLSSPKRSFFSSLTKDDSQTQPANPLSSLTLDSPLRQAEEIFIDYFLNKVAPNQESESRRETTFNRIKSVIESALGKRFLSQSHIFRWATGGDGAAVRVRSS